MTLEQKLKQLQEKIKQNPLTSVTVLIAVLLLLLIVIPIWRVYIYGINNDTVNATLENQYRATFAQILGGIAVGIGIYFAWGNLKVTQDNLKVSQEGQITERFTRAVDQLGNRKMEIRLGGIYALERIANESEKDYWSILEILTAYIREYSPRKNWNIKVEDIDPQTEVSWNTKPMLYLDENVNLKVKDVVIQKKVYLDTTVKVSSDIQAILTVIRQRNYSSFHKELNGLDMQGTHLHKANLQGADLYMANLQGADLYMANLEGANLEEANLEGANLKEAILEEANLQMAALERAYLKMLSFIRLTL